MLRSSDAVRSRTLPQGNERCSPGPVLRMIERVRNHFRILSEERMDGPAQIADSFAVNDPHFENAVLLARRQVIRYQILNFARIESMQIEHAVNWQLNRPGHGPTT